MQLVTKTHASHIISITQKVTRTLLSQGLLSIAIVSSLVERAIGSGEVASCWVKETYKSKIS